MSDPTATALRLWAWRNRVRELFGRAPLPPPTGASVPPWPRVTISLAGAVPGIVLRVLPGVVVVVLALLAGCVGYGWWVVGAAVVGVTVWPSGPAAGLYVGMVGIWVLARGDLLVVDAARTVPGVWRMSGLMLAVHVLLVGAALAGHVAWRSLVERGVLLRVAAGVVGAQAVAQSLLLLVAWLRAWQPGGHEWLRGVAVVAVVGVAALAIPREWVARRARRPRD